MIIKELRKIIGISVYDSLERFEYLNLELPLYANAHSWAGSEGQTAMLILIRELENPEKITLNSGGWYSENGRITSDKPAIPLGEELKRTTPTLGDIIVVHEWDHYNRPSPEYDMYAYYVLAEEDIIKIQGVNLPEDQEV